MLTTSQRLIAPRPATATTAGTPTSKGVNARTWITIHETGNTARGADAEMHARLQSRNACFTSRSSNEW